MAKSMRLIRRCTPLIVALALSSGSELAAAATWLNPDRPYLSLADSPFAGVSGLILENFEDGALNTPGVTATSGGVVLGPGPQTDSVDADDLAIDGLGNAGNSWFSGGNTSTFTFEFSAAPGPLPTFVGFAWTDVGASTDPAGAGFGQLTFEAFDGGGVSVGHLDSALLGDGNAAGGTAEDRFFGVISAGGVSRVVISMNASTDWEIDHLQYSATAVPVPAAGALFPFAVGLLGLWRRRTRSGA